MSRLNQRRAKSQFEHAIDRQMKIFRCIAGVSGHGSINLKPALTQIVF